MKTIKKTDISDCAICCVAMLTGASKKELIAEYGIDETGGYKYWSVIRVIKTLASLGLSYGSVFTFTTKLTDDVADLRLTLDLLKYPALLTVETDLDILEDVCHFVVWDNKERMVRDPSNKVGELTSIEEYKVLEWAVVAPFNT